MYQDEKEQTWKVINDSYNLQKIEVALIISNKYKWLNESIFFYFIVPLYIINKRTPFKGWFLFIELHFMVLMGAFFWLVAPEIRMKPKSEEDQSQFLFNAVLNQSPRLAK